MFYCRYIQVGTNEPRGHVTRSRTHYVRSGMLQNRTDMYLSDLWRMAGGGVPGDSVGLGPPNEA